MLDRDLLPTKNITKNSVHQLAIEISLNMRNIMTTSCRYASRGNIVKKQVASLHRLSNDYALNMEFTLAEDNIIKKQHYIMVRHRLHYHC